MVETYGIDEERFYYVTESVFGTRARACAMSQLKVLIETFLRVSDETLALLYYRFPIFSGRFLCFCNRIDLFPAVRNLHACGFNALNFRCLSDIGYGFHLFGCARARTLVEAKSQQPIYCSSAK